MTRKIYVVRGSSNIGRDDFQTWPIKAFTVEIKADTLAFHAQVRIDKISTEWVSAMESKVFDRNDPETSRLRSLGLVGVSDDGSLRWNLEAKDIPAELLVNPFDPAMKPGYYFCEAAGETLWGASYSVEVVELEG